MGSKGGGIFGAIANLEQNIRDKIDPVMHIIDPIGSRVIDQNNNFVNKPWLDLRNKSKEQQQPTLLAPAPADNPNQTANTRKAAPGAAQGSGALNTTMVTNPPDTDEGNKMRLSQATMLGL